MTTQPTTDRVDIHALEHAPAERPTMTTDDGEPSEMRKKWLMLAIIGLAQLMVILDATIVNIALPSAQADIGFSDDNRQWVVTAYALAFGSLLLVGGRLGDLLGRRTTFLVGLVGFGAMSAAGGAATSFDLLVAARAGQGVFAALLAPAILSLLTTTFTRPHERGRAFGIFGAIAGGGGAVGLILGGVLTEYLSWRWGFYVNVPLAVVALVGGLILLPRGVRGKGVTLDLPGSFLSIAGLVALVYGLANAETHGWTSPWTYGFILAGVVLLAVFVRVEARVAEPLLPLGVLTDRNRAGSFLALGLAGAGMFGVFLFLTYYLSTILGYEPLTTGLAFLPMVATLTVAGQIVLNVVERIGAKIPVTLGFLVAASGMLLLTQVGLDSSYASNVLPGLVVFGVGLGLIMAPAIGAATDRVDPKHAGVASASVNTFQQIGGSIGTAILSAVAAGAAGDYLLGRDSGDPTVLAQAGVESYTAAFFVSACLFAAGAVTSAIMLRHGATVRDPDGAPVLTH